MNKKTPTKPAKASKATSSPKGKLPSSPVSQLATLYKRTAAGKVQEWTIFIQGATFWTVSGQIDGKKITTPPTKAEAKNTGRSNATTPEEQAMLEARAKWTKMGDDGYTEEVGNIDGKLEEMIKPMLAKDYKEHKHKLKFPVWSQPKLDGLRCVITREGAWSRQWKPFVTLGHLCEALQPLFEKYPHIRAFDGEAYTHGLRDDFNQVVSIIKQSKAKPEDLKRAREVIEFHLYDFIPFEEVIEVEKRSTLLKSMLGKSKRLGLEFVRTDKITTQEQMDELMSEYLSEGFEGQMIRMNAPYYQKRTDALLKRKEFVDTEFLIIGSNQGKGVQEGCLCLACETDSGQTFDCTVVGGLDYRRRLWEVRDLLVGKMATVKYQNLTPKGVPRFPVCIKIRNKEGEELSF